MRSKERATPVSQDVFDTLRHRILKMDNGNEGHIFFYIFYMNRTRMTISGNLNDVTTNQQGKVFGQQIREINQLWSIVRESTQN